jgi:fluoroacetyl-CoA thioesterase
MLSPGLKRQDHRVAAPADSAKVALPIVPDVLSSAKMISFIETVCAELMAEHLSPGQTSVGIGFELTHEAPTPIGMKYSATVEVASIAGKRVELIVEARDEVDVICRGKHVRAIIDAERFMARVNEKQKAIRPG